MKVTPDSFEEVGCNVCGGRRNSTVRAIGLDDRLVARMVRCRDCGLVYTSPRPTPEFVAELYHVAYSEHLAIHPEKKDALVDDDVTPDWQDRYLSMVETVSRLAPQEQNRRFLDIGVGFGHLLGLAKAKGWEIWGTEISEEVAAVARKRTGAEILVAENLADARLPSDFFGGITMSAVIEHLRDPLSALGEIHRILKPGGTLGISTDNYDSLFFSLGTWRDLLEVRYERATGRQFPLRGRNKQRYEIIATRYEDGVYTLLPAKDDAKTVAYFCIWVFQHLFFFTPASLRKMLEKAGFRIVEHPAGSILGGPGTGKRRLLQNDRVNSLGQFIGRQSEIVYYARK